MPHSSILSLSRQGSSSVNRFLFDRVGARKKPREKLPGLNFLGTNFRLSFLRINCASIVLMQPEGGINFLLSSQDHRPNWTMAHACKAQSGSKSGISPNLPPLSPKVTCVVASNSRTSESPANFLISSYCS